MTTEEVLSELRAMSSESIKNIMQKHGGGDRIWGVKIEDMKKIQKRVKKNYELSMGLYRSGISDAMYLAGLIADEKKMSKIDLQEWVEGAYWSMLSEYTVAWIAAESNHGFELAAEWINSDNEMTAVAGWSTYSSLASIKPAEEIDLKLFRALLKKVKDSIHKERNRVIYSMNGFVIAAGCFIPELTDEALEIGKSIGKLEVEMNGTACKVPYSPDYIQKVIAKGYIGKKKKMARC